MISAYQVFNIKGNQLINNGQHFNTLSQLQQDFPAPDGWLVIDPADLPADFSTETYTIENGQLVKASAEIIAERLAIKQTQEREAIRIQREARYNSEAISSQYWYWVESGNEADKTKWIAAKDAVRAELPYPPTPNTTEQ